MAQYQPVTPWVQSPDQAVLELKSDSQQGLNQDEAAIRLNNIGPNYLQTSGVRGPFIVFLSQFIDPLIGLLAAAAFLSIFIGDLTDAVLIAVIVFANAIIGFVQEWKAQKAIQALKKLARPLTEVIRDGQTRHIRIEEIVPGDLITIRSGDIIPADCRLVDSFNLEVNESPLTGESLPAVKNIGANEKSTQIADRTCMVHTGTAVVSGHAHGIVTSTGMRTEIGRIASMLETADAGLTPLQRKLDRLSRQLGLAVILIAVFVLLLGILREPVEGRTWELANSMLLIAVSLAVAAIPEGLPAIITVTLAIGSKRMTECQAIMRKLTAVETLGSVDIICTDKTGTLTLNQMVVSEVVPASDQQEPDWLLLLLLLNSNTDIDADGQIVGSPTEVAITQAGLKSGLDLNQINLKYKKLGEISFTSERKRMSTLYEFPDGNRYLLTKGAAEFVMPLCTNTPAEEIQRWHMTVERLAQSGQRVLVTGIRTWNSNSFPDDPQDIEKELSLAGVVGLIDPARTEAKSAITSCREAGIKPMMITGDHPGTALAIASEIGLSDDINSIMTGAEMNQINDEELAVRIPDISIFARVAPEHKLRIVNLLQEQGHTVAMTGDGVNDAPALKQADIGIAMGINGTEVSREASDMILADDNFTTIVSAVAEGRIVFDNIRKFVCYLLTANLGEVLVLVGALILGMPLPLLPVHILWINLVTDGLPAITLGFELPEENIMKRRPRSRVESLFSGGLWISIVIVGTLMAVCCLCLFASYLPGNEDQSVDSTLLDKARTMVFMTLSISQLMFVMSVRSFSKSFLQSGILSNARLAGAVLIGCLLLFSVIYIPGANKLFHTTPLNFIDLMISLIVASIPVFGNEALKLWGIHLKRS